MTKKKMIEQLTPQPTREKDEISKREELIIQKKKEIDEITDDQELGVEEKIKNVCVALEVMGFDVKQSCQGHYDGEFSTGAPWVRVGARDEPKFRFNNQEEILNKVARKYNISIKEIAPHKNERAYDEAYFEYTDMGNSPAYNEWAKGAKELMKELQGLLVEFYKEREVKESVKLVLDATVVNQKMFHNGGKDFEIECLKELSPKEKRELKERLKIYQKEMNEFADFLFEKFLSGEKT